MMARRRDYVAEARRQNQLARERGYESYREQRRHTRTPSSLGDLTSLPQDARSSRSDAFRVIDLARTEHISPQESAQRLGVRWSTVRWWATESIGVTRGGRSELTRRDGLRMRPVVLEDGVEFVTARGWKRREVEKVFRIQWEAAHGMATAEELDWLRGRKVAGRQVADTQERLHELARRGEIDPVEAYRGLVA